MFRAILHEFRLSIRRLYNSPVYSLVVITTLGLGIGATGSIFAVLSELLFRPLPVANPNELFAIVLREKGAGTAQNVPFPILRDYIELNRTFKELIGYAPISTDIRAPDGQRQDASVQLVSPNYFTALGINPRLGRIFDPKEPEFSGGASAAILSHRFWQSRFAGNLDVIGKQIEIEGGRSGLAVTVIGVAAPGFEGFDRLAPDLWIPAASENWFKDFKQINFRLVGRLQPGVGPESAQAATQQITERITEKYRGSLLPGYEHEGPFRNNQALLRPCGFGAWGAFSSDSEAKTAAVVVMGAVSLVLLIACANIACLQLVRALRRRKEFAIRLALGATRGDLVRQLLVESAALSALGGGAGLLLICWLGASCRIFLPQAIGLSTPLAVDYRVVLFSAFLSLMTGILFGSAPAMQSFKVNMNSVLKEDGSAADPKVSGIRWGATFTTFQVATCFVVLIGTGLCIKTYDRLKKTNLGFRTSNCLVVPVELNGSEFSESYRLLILRELFQRLSTLPGALSVTFASSCPLRDHPASLPISQIEGASVSPRDPIQLEFNRIGPGYFETLGIPYVKEPAFRVSGNAPRFIVTESFARKFWPEADPIGKHFGFYRVDGVAQNSAFHSVRDLGTPLLYWQVALPDTTTTRFFIRFNGDHNAFRNGVAREVNKVKSPFDASSLQTFDQIIANSLQDERSNLAVFTALGATALFLASIGLYGILSSMVVQRRREIGIRIALGADRASVMSTILWRGFLLAGGGIILGSAVALALGRALASLTFGFAPADPIIFLTVAITLAMIAFLSTLFPARRAALVDPNVTLRGA